jgi:hypothetical protein
MKHVLAALIVVMSGSVCFAQQAKIIKVKGQQAIVDFPADVKPQVGQILELGTTAPPPASEPVVRETISTTEPQRRFTAGIQALSLSYLNNSVSNKYTTAISLEGRGGMNQGQLEFGPILGLGYRSTDNYTYSQYYGGGFIDINLVPNRPGTALIYGIGGQGTIGSTTEKVYSKETNTTEYVGEGGPFLKWFIPKTTVALRSDGVFYYQRKSSGSTNEDNVGALVKAGFQVYF